MNLTRLKRWIYSLDGIDLVVGFGIITAVVFLILVALGVIDANDSIKFKVGVHVNSK